MVIKDLEPAKERAFNLLSYRSRTKVELSLRLKKDGFSPAAITAVISHLEEYNLIDDHSYACDWVRYRFERKKKGRYYLYNELIQKGIPSTIASEAVGSITDAEEYQAAYEQALSKIKSGREWPSVGRYLARQGFPNETILKVGRQITVLPVDD